MGCVKISDSEYRVGGNTSFFGDIFNLCQNFDLGDEKRTNRWERIVLNDLEFIGVPAVVFWDFRYTHYDTEQQYTFSIYSQVPSINILLALQDEHAPFGDDVLLFTERKGYTKYLQEKRFFNDGLFVVPIFWYGAAYGFFAEIDAKRFLNMDFTGKTEIKAAYKGIVPGLEKVKKHIPEDQKFDIAHNLFSRLIESKKHEQPRIIRPRLHSNGFAGP